MTLEEAQNIIEPLLMAGYAVTFFTPEEMGDVPTDDVIDGMIVGGNNAIDYAPRPA